MDSTQTRATKGYFVRFWWVVLLPVIVALVLMLMDRKDDVVPDAHDMEEQPASTEPRE